MRAGRVLAAALLVALLGAPGVAAAQDGGGGADGPAPPAPAPEAPGAAPVGPDLADVSPERTITQTTRCPAPSGQEDLVEVEPWAQTQLGVRRAHQIATGAGQRVAVIDTGVTPHPRLPGLLGLGDYVQPGGDGRAGLLDCDAHGTLVAGIIAAASDPDTAFVGVAPDAQVLSIRQSSGAYSYEPPRVEGADGVGDALTLARSVSLAVDSGATVINISESACVLAADVSDLQDAGLGAALRRAVDSNVVVVVAAGNLGSADGGSCPAPNYDEESGGGVGVVATPAWWDDYVLTVGSVGRSGEPSEFSLAGPWVDVAAPGEEILSISPLPGSTGLANQLLEGGRPQPVQGTSFAAPYVAGTVALVREAFPELDARQVMERVQATAHPPAGGWNPQVGFGVIDPVAAVSDVLPADVTAQRTSGGVVAADPLPGAAPVDSTPRTVAFVGTGAAVLVAGITFAVLDAVRRWRRVRV